MSFCGIRVPTIASAPPTLIRLRGLSFKVLLNFQLGSVSGLSQLFPGINPGDPKPPSYIVCQALPVEFHQFLLREASPGTTGGSTKSLNIVPYSLPLPLFCGGEREGGNFY